MMKALQSFPVPASTTAPPAGEGVTRLPFFKKEQYGATVATILETEDSIVEVQERNDGQYGLIVHSRRCDNDRWDDISAYLKPEHFDMLGAIARRMRGQSECCQGLAPESECQCALAKIAWGPTSPQKPQTEESDDAAFVEIRRAEQQLRLILEGPVSSQSRPELSAVLTKLAKAVALTRRATTKSETDGAAMRTENARLREALKPFASPKFTTDEEGQDDIALRGINGEVCIPDGHGYELVWADETKGGRVVITAGQIRRARAALARTPAAETDIQERDEPCEYCGDGKLTGLPGNACENCMNTGLKNPDAKVTRTPAADNDGVGK